MIAPVQIEPSAIYDDGALYQTLGLREGTLARARRAGELRYVRKGPRTLYLGRWLIDWLTRDEASQAPRSEAPACA